MAPPNGGGALTMDPGGLETYFRASIGLGLELPISARVWNPRALLDAGLSTCLK